MSAIRKNIAVGLTALLAMVLLGWMILRFSDAPFRLFSKPEIRIRFRATSAEGLGEGSPIYYLGVNVGRVVRASHSEDQLNVLIDAIVENDPPLPANIEGRIRTQLIGGGSSISLVLVPPAEIGATQPSARAETRPVAIVPVGRLEAGQIVKADFLGFDLMPREFTDLARDLTETSAEVREFSRSFRSAELIPKLSATIDSLKANIDKAGRTIDSFNELIEDDKIRQNIKETFTNLNEASATARRVAANLETLSKNANTRLDQLADQGSGILTSANRRLDQIAEQIARSATNVESVTRKLDEGKGTGGKLVNDPALYDSMLDASKELRQALLDLRRLLDQWEQEGMPVKLGK